MTKTVVNVGPAAVLLDHQAPLVGSHVSTDFWGVKAQNDLQRHRYDQMHQETMHLDLCWFMSRDRRWKKGAEYFTSGSFGSSASRLYTIIPMLLYSTFASQKVEEV